jgi:hypothetical protein
LDNGAVLSQDAIDALLNSAPSDAPADAPAAEAAPAAVEEPVVNVVEAPPLNPEITDDGGAAALGIAVTPPPAAAAPAAPAAAPAAAPIPQGDSPIPPAPVYQPLPPPPPLVPPPVVAQPGKGGITREEATEIAGEAAETESAPIQASVSRISKRVDTLEMALDRIAELEEEIDRIKKKPEPKIEPDPRVLALFDRLNTLEERAKNSPVFGLYEKFTCGSCGHLGEAQVRSRCGHCEKEGWFGKRSKKGSHPEHDAHDGHDADQAAEETAVQEAVAETDDVLAGLDLNLGI